MFYLSGPGLVKSSKRPCLKLCIYFSIVYQRQLRYQRTVYDLVQGHTYCLNFHLKTMHTVMIQNLIETVLQHTQAFNFNLSI